MILHHKFLVTLHPQFIILFIYSLLWYTDNFKSVPPLAQSNIPQIPAWQACIVNGWTNGTLKFNPFIFFVSHTFLCISPSVKGPPPFLSDSLSSPVKRNKGLIPQRIIQNKKIIISRHQITNYFNIHYRNTHLMIAVVVLALVKPFEIHIPPSVINVVLNLNHTLSKLN